MQETLENYGPDSGQYSEALGSQLVCLGQMIQTRESYAAARDEGLYQLQREIRQASERLVGKLKVPPRPTFGGRSLEAKPKIFANKTNAMVFSEKSEEAFRKLALSWMMTKLTLVLCVSLRRHSMCLRRLHWTYLARTWRVYATCQLYN